MSLATLETAARALYETQFDVAPAGVVSAPGRVNLLGEHTDYNGGLVLPSPLPIGTALAIGYGGPAGQITLRSQFPGEDGPADSSDTRQISDAKQDRWSDYFVGAIASFLGGDVPEQGLQITAVSDLPAGSGLSSSAALLVATLRAMSVLTGRAIDPEHLAADAQKVENDFIGLPCGILDHFAISVGTPDMALFLDTATMKHRSIPLPTSHRFAVVHSGTGHELAATEDGALSGYALRVHECQTACAALGVSALSHLGLEDMDKITALPQPQLGRARHVVTENARVRDAVEAMAAGDMAALGAAMNGSHASQATDYEVSTPAIDALVENARHAGAVAARLTGGGFGGSIVALVEDSKVAEWTDAVLKSSPKARVLAIC